MMEGCWTTKGFSSGADEQGINRQVARQKAAVETMKAIGERNPNDEAGLQAPLKPSNGGSKKRRKKHRRKSRKR